MISTFLPGFGLGFSLILAIGAQNAFVLRQGLRGEHLFAVCLTCAVSDALLISGGVVGFGTLAQAYPRFETVMRWGGAGFLLIYGALALRSAWRGTSALKAADTAKTGLGATLAVVLALTWLNPHVYLDTVVLIGSISAQYDNRLVFGAGAVSASFVFFFGLGYGARRLQPLFARPRAWAVLDICIGLVMWMIAWGLIAM
ncbi:MAG: LysE/ArgO family amino acid transporter [Rhodobacteraceae bacterium]|nr:LysE/ArgO family amino acid transporter [Paracoccaceae bacterium]